MHSLNLRLVADLKPGRCASADSTLRLHLPLLRMWLSWLVTCHLPVKYFSKGRAQTYGRGEDADVVIAKTDEGYEPFHALYRREACQSAIEAAIEADQWKVISWFSKVRVRELTSQEVKAFDPAGLCFWNLNTPVEFAEAEKRASG